MQLEKAGVVKKEITPRLVVVVADTTFFGREYGITVFRDPNIKKNHYWEEIRLEKPLVYAEGRYYLEKKGFTIQVVVVDGRKGLKEVFRGIPVQMCQFHQIAIINRYLTRRPRLEASQELRSITLGLTKTNKETFTKQLDKWHKKWESFLKEKTFNIETNRWFYTHKRVRSAHRGLKTNLPYLFTYQEHPELNIPNTTNSMEGYFSKLKCLLGTHRGLKRERRYKVICEILNE